MIQVSMPAAVRSEFGKGASRQLRMQELTPAVLYSKGSDAVALQCETGELYKKLVDIHGRNAVIKLEIEGDEQGERHVLLQEIQKNPVTDSVVHVDFMEIQLDKPSIFSVPLKFKGTPKGVDLGGDLQVASQSVELKGCPLDIPDAIEVDIKSLNRGDSLSFSDIALPDKVEMMNDDSYTIVSVY